MLVCRKVIFVSVCILSIFLYLIESESHGRMDASNLNIKNGLDISTYDASIKYNDEWVILNEYLSKQKQNINPPLDIKWFNYKTRDILTWNNIYKETIQLYEKNNSLRVGTGQIHSKDGAGGAIEAKNLTLVTRFNTDGFSKVLTGDKQYVLINENITSWLLGLSGKDKWIKWKDTTPVFDVKGGIIESGQLLLMTANGKAAGSLGKDSIFLYRDGKIVFPFVVNQRILLVSLKKEGKTKWSANIIEP